MREFSNLQTAVSNRRLAAGNLAIAEKMLARDRAEDNAQGIARSLQTVARMAASLSEIDAALDLACIAWIAARSLPSVAVYARQTPATSEEPAESWHEIECPTCRDWFAVEYADGIERVTCGGCDTAYRPIPTARESLPVEQVNEILIENLPEIAGIRFLGAVPR